MKWQALARGVALADDRGAMSADELATRVAALAAALQDSLPRVRVLGVQADNGNDWVVIDLAAQEAGIVLVPLPAFFTRAQCAHAVAVTGMDALFSIAPGEAQALGFGEPCALPGVAVALMRREGQPRVVPPQTTKITFTSGTTGTPKGICLDARTQWRVAEGLVAALRDVVIERHLCLLPLPVLLENIAGVYAAMRKTMRLAEQMLAYSRASAPTDDVMRKTVSLRAVVEDVIEENRPRMVAQGNRFAMSCEPVEDAFDVHGDYDKLASLVGNLVENAIRYGPRGGAIRVDLASDAGIVTFAVADEGPGIGPELRERVFESYFRAPGTSEEGTGLGLAIVKEIAGQHAAVIDIGEGGSGRGTRVTVRFPAIDLWPGSRDREAQETAHTPGSA